MGFRYRIGQIGRLTLDIFTKYLFTLVVLLVASQIYFSEYSYFGFEQIVNYSFTDIFPATVIMQATLISVRRENKVLFILINLAIYSITFGLLMGIYSLVYVPIYLVLYVIDVFAIGMYLRIRHKENDTSIEDYYDEAYYEEDYYEDEYEEYEEYEDDDYVEFYDEDEEYNNNNNNGKSNIEYKNNDIYYTYESEKIDDGDGDDDGLWLDL